MTDGADKEGRRCYLGSSRNEPNITIYEKTGLKLVKDMACNDDGAVCKVRYFNGGRDSRVLRAKLTG